MANKKNKKKIYQLAVFPTKALKGERAWIRIYHAQGSAFPVIPAGSLDFFDADNTSVVSIIPKDNLFLVPHSLNKLNRFSCNISTIAMYKIGSIVKLTTYKHCQVKFGRLRT